MPAHSLAQLRQLQRLAGCVIMRPLDPRWRTQRRWIDHRDMRTVAATFIKPNDRLSSLERIEIYNRQYWFRLIDCMFEDYPGLLAVLGRSKFTALIRQYLAHNPSRSYTLRNLGSHLLSFIRRHRDLVAPHYDLAVDMARFEWSQIQAFDGPSHPALAVDDLLGQDPARLRLTLQPHLSVLKLRYPLDDFVLQLKQDGLRGEASNAVDDPRAAASRPRRPILPPRSTVYLVVHRHRDSLYYKRIDARAYRLLRALHNGQTLQDALDLALKNAPDAAAAVAKEWFQTWAALAWFCNPPNY